MHELTLAENIVQLVEQTASRERARRVKTVYVEIGRLAAVDTDALRFAFEVVTRSGSTATAQLTIIDVDGAGTCSDCGAATPMNDLYAVCAQCGSAHVHVISGHEMRVKEIEIES